MVSRGGWFSRGGGELNDLIGSKIRIVIALFYDVVRILNVFKVCCPHARGCSDFFLKSSKLVKFERTYGGLVSGKVSVLCQGASQFCCVFHTCLLNKSR